MLDRPYSIATRLKGFLPVLRGDSHGDADLPNGKTPLPVKNLDLLYGPPLSDLCLDLPHPLLGHRAVRLVLQPLHGAAFVDAEDGPQKKHDAPWTLILHRVDHFRRVYSALGQVNRSGCAPSHRFPPATGGRRATSSPSWSTVLGSASWEFTATLIERFIAASFGWFFETIDSSASIVEWSDRVIASSPVPAASRARAKYRTLTLGVADYPPIAFMFRGLGHACLTPGMYATPLGVFPTDWMMDSESSS